MPKRRWIILQTEFKKAVLMLVLDTDYAEARQLAVGSAWNPAQSSFPNYEVRRAFASRDLIEELADRDGITVDDEKQALQRLEQEGFTEVIVQPFRFSAGEQYERVIDVVREYVERKAFNVIESLPCLNITVRPRGCILN
jgi:cobalamin biosynthesis Co2+ chelatase CbiK